MTPPRTEKAIAMLRSFRKRACRGTRATKFKEQCEVTAALLGKLAP